MRTPKPRVYTSALTWTGNGPPRPRWRRSSRNGSRYEIRADFAFFYEGMGALGFEPRSTGILGSRDFVRVLAPVYLDGEPPSLLLQSSPDAGERFFGTSHCNWSP